MGERGGVCCGGFLDVMSYDKVITAEVGATKVSPRDTVFVRIVFGFKVQGYCFDDMVRKG